MEISSEPQVETSNQENEVPPPKTGFWGFMHNTGTKILGVMDYVGETVVGVLGLDDSKFQYVMDGMDKEEWEKAISVDRERRLEDAIFEAAEELQEKDKELQAEEGGDVEGGGDLEEKKIRDYMNLVRDRVTTEFWEKEIEEHPEVEREIRQVVPDEILPIVRAENVTVSSEEVRVLVTGDETTTTTELSVEKTETVVSY